jgi:hypothetical protein
MIGNCSTAGRGLGVVSARNITWCFFRRALLLADAIWSSFVRRSSVERMLMIYEKADGMRPEIPQTMTSDWEMQIKMKRGLRKSQIRLISEHMNEIFPSRA